MTQPSEFEQVVETLQLATWQSDILSIAHNADTAAQVAAAQAKVWRAVKWHGDGTPIEAIADEALAALSGQEPAHQHTWLNASNEVVSGWEVCTCKAMRTADGTIWRPNGEGSALLADGEPAKPCKTCNGSGQVEKNDGHDYPDAAPEMWYKDCPDCNGTGVAKA